MLALELMSEVAETEVLLSRLPRKNGLYLPKIGEPKNQAKLFGGVRALKLSF
jgi:hypothetical protein